MMRTRDAALAVYHAGNTSTSRADADVHIPGGHLKKVEITENGQDVKDTASIEVENTQGQYNGVEHGDRVEFWVADESTASTGARYGNTVYGGFNASASMRLAWVGYQHPFKNKSSGAGNYTLSLELADYVYARMATQRYWGSFNGRQIAGESDSVLNEVLSKRCPEIDRSNIGTVTDTLTLRSHGMKLIDILKRCIAAGDLYAFARGKSLVVTQPERRASRFVATHRTRDYSGEEFASKDDGLVNNLRIKGGPSAQEDEDYSTVDHLERVNDDPATFLTRQLNTTKGAIAEVEIFTSRVSGGGDLQVAIQADDGGTPEAVADTKADIENPTLSGEFLDDDHTDGDGTQVNIDDGHHLPGTNPWLIVRGTNSTGIDVGADVNGNLACRTFYPYPTNVQKREKESIDRYRQRDGKRTDKTLRSTTEAEDRADAILRHEAYPDTDVGFEAESRRAHRLALGDLFTVDDPWLGADGVYVVTKRDLTYEHSTLRVNVGATALDSL